MTRQRCSTGSSTSALSVSFEAATALLSFVDVATDVLVCHEFFAAGHWGWGTLVLLSITATTGLFAFGGAQFFHKHPVTKHLRFGIAEWSQWRWGIMLLPVAQLVPLVAWLTMCMEEAGIISSGNIAVTRTDPAERRSWAEVASVCGLPHDKDDAAGPRVTRRTRRQQARPSAIVAAKKTAELTGSVVAQELCTAAATEFSALWSFHNAVDRHWQKHMFFLLETVVEAAPQAVIQLLAISSIAESPSPLRWLSVVVSVLVIATKLHLVCRSFDLKMHAFKVCLAVMDLFAFFYVFSSLLAPRHEGSPTFLPFCLPWEFVSAVWVSRTTIVAVLALVFLACGIATVAFTPFAFARDAMTFGWLILLDSRSFMSGSEVPRRSLQASFIRSGNTFREQNRRLLAVLDYESGPVCAGLGGDHNAMVAEAKARFDAQRDTHRVDSTDDSPLPYRMWFAAQRWLAEIADPLPLRLLMCCHDMSDFMRSTRDRPLEALAALLCTPYFITQALLLPLPLVNYIVEEGLTLSPMHQNGFQLFCLAVWCAAALGALLLLPAAVPCVRLSLAMHTIVSAARQRGVQPRSVKDLLAFMARTLMPEPRDVLRHAVPTTVVPMLVRDFVIEPYVGGLRLGLLTYAECGALRE